MSEHTEGKLKVLSDGLTIKAIIDYTPHYDAEPPQMLVARCFQNGHLGRTERPTKEDLANAAELVRRWNAFEEGGSHKALVDACEKAKGILENAQGEWSAVVDTYAPQWTQPLKAAIDIIDAALAQAQPSERGWKCEWHFEEASEIVSEQPEKCKVIYCQKCRCKTWHAFIKAQSKTSVERK